MEISLRKAHALQLKIIDAIFSIEVPTTVRINEFQQVEPVLIETRNKTIAGIKRKLALESILTDIRQKVCIKNYTSRITYKLTRIANLSRNIKTLSNITKSAGPQENIEILEKRLDKFRTNTSENMYHREGTVEASVLNKEEVDTYKKMLVGLEKQKAEEQDAILALNIETKIIISEDDVETLKEENLI